MGNDNWAIDNSDRDRTIWHREGAPFFVETYEWDEDGERVDGYTVSHVEDGMPVGGRGDYMRFRELDDAIAFAEHEIDTLSEPEGV